MLTLPNPRRLLRLWPARRDSSAALADLRSAAEMRETLERERMRADRSGASFAVVVFRLTERDSRRQLAALAAILRERLRATDVAGYLDTQRIAVLLPETGEAGAGTLAAYVGEAVAARYARLDCEIFLYPHSAADGGRVLAAEPRDTSTAEPVPRAAGDLFLKPLPLWKRGLDIVGAVVGLLVAAPIMLLAAVAIKATSPGPIFFKQKRTGLGGSPFTIYKLRTMRTDAEQLKAALRVHSEQDGPAFKMEHDPRVTPVGRFLRNTAIDELPQLWNVLWGDMSLVGPRPLPIDEADQCLGWQRRRLHVTPGLTCIWQVFGGMRVPFQEWMRMDIRYITRRQLWLDVVLLWRTFLAVIRRRASR